VGAERTEQRAQAAEPERRGTEVWQDGTGAMAIVVLISDDGL
jgi:hypothetical protein